MKDPFACQDGLTSSFPTFSWPLQAERFLGILSTECELRESSIGVKNASIRLTGCLSVCLPLLFKGDVSPKLRGHLLVKIGVVLTVSLQVREKRGERRRNCTSFH